MDTVKRKKLVLHFDARNTLFLADMCYRITVEEALNSYITGLVWGYLVEDPEHKNEPESTELPVTVNNQPQTASTKICQGQLQNGYSSNSLTNIKSDLNHTNDTANESNSVQNCVHLNSTKTKPNYVNCKNNQISTVVNLDPDQPNTKRQPYVGEDFENLTPHELDRFKSVLANWRCLPESPCIRQPRSDAISIYKMLERQIVKFPKDRGRLRKYLGNFTQTTEGEQFFELFASHLAMIRWPLTLNPNRRLTVMGHNQIPYHYLMPAFFRLLAWLVSEKREFSVLLRTYGREGPHVLSAIEAYIEDEHPYEKPNQCETFFNIDHTKWRLKRQLTKPLFSLESEVQNSDVKHRFQTPQHIYNEWSRWDGILSVVDDFGFWQTHNYHQTAAKPFWINPSDSNVHPIIFDDNIRFEDDGSNGVDLHCLDESDSGSHSLTVEEACQWEDVYFVQADLLNIIRNPNYFIDKVMQCETNLEKAQTSKNCCKF